jgi:hypothetical protein
MSVAGAFTVWSRQHTPAALALSARTRGILRGLWGLAAFVFGVLLLRRLSTLGDWRAAWSRCLELGAPLLVLLALPAMGHFVKMLGWRNLLPASQRPSLRESYAAFVAAQAVNELGFSVLGEPLKVIVLARHSRAEGLRAVVADNLSALLALLVVSATLLARPWLVAPLVVGALVLLHAVKRRAERRFIVAFGAHYLGKLWLVAEIALGLHFLGEASLAAAAPLALAALGAAAIGAPVPGQLGVVEAALVHSGAALGVAPSSLLALALIRRIRGLVWLVLGLLLAAAIVHRKQKGVWDVPTTAA